MRDQVTRALLACSSKFRFKRYECDPFFSKNKKIIYQILSYLTGGVGVGSHHR